MTNSKMLYGFTEKPYSYRPKKGNKILDFWFGKRYEILFQNTSTGVIITELSDVKHIVSLMNSAYGEGWLGAKQNEN